MIRRIQYTDAKDNDTSIEWFKATEYSSTFMDRVADDGGILEAKECLIPSSDYHDFCGGKKPLGFKWYGERYDNVKPSVIKVNVLVKNKDDADIMEEQLNGGYYIRVLKNGKLFWVGKLHPQYYQEPYKQYPYVISFSASDQLGQMKNYQPLMVDFSVPHAQWRLIDFLNRFLTEPTFKPLALIDTAPSILRFSGRIYQAKTQDLLDTIYLDPRAFMKFGSGLDEYIDKQTILKSILKPLHLKLFQWQGIWYLMSLDAQWDAGKLTYADYSLDYINGATKIKSDVLDEGILDLYNPSQMNMSDPDNHEVFETASMEFLPVWGQYTISREFERNTELLPFANRNGNFYYGDGLTALELDWYGETNTKKLTHWNPNFPRSLEEDEFPPENSGRLSVPQVDDSDGMWVKYIVPLPPIDYTQIEINFVAANNKWFGFNTRMSFEFEDPDGNIWWLENDAYPNDLSNMDPKWRDYFVSFHAPVFASESGGKNINVKVSNPSASTTFVGSTLTMAIYPIGSYYQDPNHRGILNNMRIALVNKDLELSKYKFDTVTEVSVDGTQPPFEIKLTWGISHPRIPDNWHIHLSSPYSIEGYAVNAFLKDGSAGEFPDYNLLTNWLILNYFDGNSTYTPQLTGAYRSTEASPVRLVQDYEGRIYDFTEGEYDDKSATWTNILYTQYKDIRNIPELPVKCDYSTYNFNGDFCTEFQDGYQANFYKRVVADGGVVEALSCIM